MKFKDLKVGDEFYLKVVVANFSIGEKGEEVGLWVEPKGLGNYFGDEFFSESDFNVLDVKPVTKAERNAATKKRIAELKKQIKQAESELIK